MVHYANYHFYERPLVKNALVHLWGRKPDVFHTSKSDRKLLKARVMFKFSAKRLLGRDSWTSSLRRVKATLQVVWFVECNVISFLPIKANVLIHKFTSFAFITISYWWKGIEKSRLSYLFLLFNKYLLISGSAYIVNLYLKKGWVIVIVRSLHLRSSCKASSKLNNTSSFVHPRKLPFRETCQS